MGEITFKFARLQKVEFQLTEGTRFRPATVTSRVPCEPYVLYRVRVDGQPQDIWALEGQMRPLKKGRI